MIFRVTLATGTVHEVPASAWKGEAGDLVAGNTYTPENTSWWDDVLDGLRDAVPGNDEFASVEAVSDGPGRTRSFFWYDAAKVKLAIDPARPWQCCTTFGVLIGKYATSQQARAYCEALQVDDDAGTLPCDLSKWDKRHLFV